MLWKLSRYAKAYRDHENGAQQASEQFQELVKAVQEEKRIAAENKRRVEEEDQLKQRGQSSLGSLISFRFKAHDIMRTFEQR